MGDHVQILANFRALFLPAAAALLLATPALADDVVKQAQTMLNALGYKVGTPDGAAGKKTLAAMDKVSVKYGQTFDGTVSENEVAFLAAIVPQKLTVDFKVAVSELFFLDSGDINGDGRLDFALSAMADPFEQLGIACCEVPANRMKDLVSPVPILVYSTPDGYAAQTFPPEAKGNKSQAGRLFTTPAGSYFVLAKNGEMGLPTENHGEVSQVFRITPSATGMEITTVATYEGRGVSANVDVADLDGNGWPEIYLNNYGPIGPVAQVEMSPIRQFGADEKLQPTDFTAALETDKAHNFITLRDLDGDGKIDLLAAAEIWKSLDGKEMVSQHPGSYVILDPFSRKTTAADRIYLPPHYGNDHAGFSVMPVTADGRYFVFEVAMQFLGHQGGGFVYDNLDVFEYSPADKSMTLVTKEVLPKVSATREKAGGYYLRTADLDFDGVNEVYRHKYANKPQYMDWNGKIFALKDFPSSDYFHPGWLGTMAYLPDPTLKCTRLVTFPEYLGEGKTRADLRINTCKLPSELK